MGYTLLATYNSTRLYRFNRPISKTRRGAKIFFGERGEITGEKICTSTRYVVVSDAWDHLERVAFAAQFVNCEDETEGIKAYNAGLIIPTHRRFADESRYEQPFVEVEFGQNTGGRIGWLIDGWGGRNLDLIMTDEEILEEILQANSEEG